MTGEQEIYCLRDKIKEWKSDTAKIGRTVMLYDLSKFRAGEGYNKAEERNGFVPNYWRVFLGDFKIRRSSDRPFTYRYTLECTGVDPTDFKSPLAEEEADKLTDWIKSIENFADKIENLFAFTGDVNAVLNKLQNAIQRFKDALQMVADALAGAVESVLSMFNNLANIANSLLNLPGDITNMALNLGLECMNSALDTLKNCVDVVDTVISMKDADYWANKDTLDAFGMTADEFKDAVKLECSEAEESAEGLVAWAKSEALPVIQVGAPGPDGKPRMVLSYGDSTVRVTSVDTLEGLAMKYCGDPDKAIDIAAYNGVASLNEIPPGTTIKIPLLKKAPATRNKIYALPGDRDNYGRDIAMSDDGSILAGADGDYKLAGGAENLSRAILLRLRESVNKRIRLNAYGIRNNISDPAAGVAYILSSIDLTVKSDPRVKSVDGINFTGQGDNLNVAVYYTDINSAAGSATGRA
jgi:hypothetical protein